VERNVQHAITSNYQNSAYITKGDKGLAIGLVGSDDEGEDDDLSPRSRKKKKKAAEAAAAKGNKGGLPMTREAFEVTNIYGEDANQIDLIKNISSMELLAISEQFNNYPDEELDLE
jgi:hypothetical protein